MESQQPHKHGPCRLSNYVSIHETVMWRFRDTLFVGHDTLAFTNYGSLLVLAGQIGCQGQLVLTVNKTLALADGLVQTRFYSYNASVDDYGNIFRYDNFHAHAGHKDAHHKHNFDWKSKNERGNPEWVGARGWPTLGEVMEELRVWHSEHYKELEHPEAYPTKLESGVR